MERIAVGDFQITLIRDGVYWWDGGALFGVVPKTLWSRKIPCDELNRVPLAFNCYVIETGDHTVLIETGGGDKMDSVARDRMKLPAQTRPLPEVIADAGIDPEGIDVVVNTHLHWDHCGGNTVQAGDRWRPSFPGARYFARRGEWEHAHRKHPRDSVSYLDCNYDPLIESGHMVLLDENPAAIIPGIRADVAFGHNRDMMVVRAESQGQTFCMLADLVPTAAHLMPTWVAAFDLYPLECIDSKTKWLTRAVEGDWLCGFGHDLEIAFTGVAREKNRFVERR